MVAPLVLAVRFGGCESCGGCRLVQVMMVFRYVVVVEIVRGVCEGCGG